MQAIFEFQTYMTQLTGMELANASLYDGSTALAEAVLMAQRIAKKNRFLIARTVHPEYRAVCRNVCEKSRRRYRTDRLHGLGSVDMAQLETTLGRRVAAVVVQSPNFFGTIEERTIFAEAGA